MIIGYHASHEQFAPSDLLNWTVQAEKAGFAAAMCSDHSAPWSEQQGESGFAFSWLGAALQSTDMSFGSVTTPGYRYHPLIIAQATATLCSMFEGRYWIALGSGEALNERMVGLGWPEKDERDARLRECVEIIRALWRGETVTHQGLVRTDQAQVWSLPATPPTIVGAALSEQTARSCGAWADALITVNAPSESLRRIVDAFRERGGSKPVYLQSHVSWAATLQEAEGQALDHWRSAVLPAQYGQNLSTPAAFDAMASSVNLEDMTRAVRISDDLHRHRAWLEEDLTLGFDRVFLHNVGPNQEAFIDAFGESVLPEFAVS